MATLTIDQARDTVAQVLQRAGANASMAQATARSLVLAEAQGLGSHGFSRVVQYASHLRNGRVDGTAFPEVRPGRAGALGAACGWPIG